MTALSVLEGVVNNPGRKTKRLIKDLKLGSNNYFSSDVFSPERISKSSADSFLSK